MKIKSYYMTQNDIIVRDYDNNTTVLELNRENLMNMINSLDEQLGYSMDTIVTEEDKAYKKLINALAISTIVEVFLTYIIFMGFTHASYVGMILGIILSLGLVSYSIIVTIISARKIRLYKKQYRIYEGREILIKAYNSLSKGLDAELVDVY